MEVVSSWTAKVTTTSAIGGQNTLSCSLNGNMEFNVFLSQLTRPQDIGGQIIPKNSVVGRMAGNFDAQASTSTRLVTGNGTAQWTLAGTYDPVKETINVAIRSAGAEANGLETVLGDAARGTTPTAHPFSMKFAWGWQAPKSDWRHSSWADDPSAIMDVMKTPMVPVIPSERESHLFIVNSLPQTGLNELKHLEIDLKEPKPQTIIQTFQDETGWGTRTNVWMFMLIPNFNIERDDRLTDGRHSFVSTDSISLRMDIPGVTVAKSGWANLTSWEVKGLNQFSGSGVPHQLQQRTTFVFRTNPAVRPTAGSTVRNRPIQYRCISSF